MSHLISLMPGLGFTCFVFLFVVSLFQYHLYRKTKYQRSRDLSLFCFFTSIFAAAPFISHSRAFPAEFLHIFTFFSVLSLNISSIYYLKSINYFITFPRWVYNLVFKSNLLVALFAFLAIPSYFLFSYSFFFYPGDFLETDNFFVNSYTTTIGSTNPVGMIILSLSGLINTLFSAYLLRIVLKSSQDIYFIIGLIFTIFASILENAFLPFTLKFFFPIVFLSNLFEAFRMNHLINNESIRDETLKELNKFDEEPESEKYQNSNLDEDRLKALAVKITNVFEKDKIFLNPNLNSEQLARAIGIPSYQLSQVINIGLNTTFFDLLSKHRIEEVKRRLAHPQFAEQTIINIAYECGFNSKSSFNTAFKKYTDMTPSQFRSQMM